eukprot:4896510-Prymnesium_polylepis.1
MKTAVLRLRGVVGVATEAELGLGKARAIALAAHEESLRRGHWLGASTGSGGGAGLGMCQTRTPRIELGHR